MIAMAENSQEPVTKQPQDEDGSDSSDESTNLKQSQENNQRLLNVKELGIGLSVGMIPINAVAVHAVTTRTRRIRIAANVALVPDAKVTIVMRVAVPTWTVICVTAVRAIASRAIAARAIVVRAIAVHSFAVAAFVEDVTFDTIHRA